jgi:hypothetical protein
MAEEKEDCGRKGRWKTETKNDGKRQRWKRWRVGWAAPKNETCCREKAAGELGLLELID